MHEKMKSNVKHIILLFIVYWNMLLFIVHWNIHWNTINSKEN